MTIGPDGEALIMWMYVVPAARGGGMARELLQALELWARQRAVGSVRLDTHDSLAEANRLYTRAGYREIPDYNGNPSANRWFEKLFA